MKTKNINTLQSDQKSDTMNDSAKSDLLEDLVALYLRLNGFFTNGFIVHNPAEGNRSEVDVLAVRFPLHREPEREIGDDGLLNLSSDHIEFAFCEVKGGKPKIQCNDALRKSPDGISRLLRRLGMFSDVEVSELVQKVQDAITPKEVQTPAIITVDAPKQTRIRFYFFAPDLTTPSRNQAFFIGGNSVLSFIVSCLVPIEKRCECAVNYGSGQWGRHFAPLVHFFKSYPPGTIPSIEQLYNDASLQAAYTERPKKGADIRLS